MISKKIVLFIVISFLTGLLLVPKSVTVFDNTQYVELPILMYHSVLKDTSRTGKYIITPEIIVQDILYLQKNGYETISAKQLVRFVLNGEALPEKPVMLTFDDGMYNNLLYVVPILEKYNAHAIFSVVGSYTDEYSKSDIVNPAYSYMRWCDIKSLAFSENVEFANHSYNLHSTSQGRYGVKKKKGETALEYYNFFQNDTKKLQSEFLSNCNFEPFIYTYPLGGYSAESTRVIEKMGFLISFSCIEGINNISENADCLHLLKRYNRDGRLSSLEFFKKTGI